MDDDTSSSDPLFLEGRVALLSSLCALLMHKTYDKASLDGVIEEAIAMIESDNNRPGNFHRGASYQFHEMRRVLGILQDKGA